MSSSAATPFPGSAPGAPVGRPRRALGSVRRAVLRRRRLLAAALLGVAVTAGLRAVAAPAPPVTAVLVAAHDLPAGAVVDAADLVESRMPPEAVPSAVLADPTGRTLAAPLRAGEPVTDVRVVGPGTAHGLDDVVAVPLRLPDAGSVALLTVGDRLDLHATEPRGESTGPVAVEVPVLALPDEDGENGASGLPGRLVVVGLDDDEVGEVTAAAVRSVLTYTWSQQ